VTLRNYGETAAGVTAVLSTDDPYVTIHAGSASYGDMPPGATAVNAGEPFVVSADPAAPEGHAAELTVTATYDGGETTSTFVLIVGRLHFLVWDPTSDASSGSVIAGVLAGLGYSGDYRQILPVDALDRYRTLWISVGIYPSNFLVEAYSEEALAVTDFLEAGGCAFLEGGDVWYYDPLVGGHDFKSAFGIVALQDGTADCGPVDGIVGEFTEGMSFTYTGENSWIDHIVPGGGAMQVLENGSPQYGIGVANKAGDSRTVGTSFELAGLVDGVPPSTRADFVQGVMDFLLPPDTGIDEGAIDLAGCGLRAVPNPFNPRTTLSFANPRAGHVRLAVYDVSGRLVRVLADGELAADRHEFGWDGRDARGTNVASGVYFARVTGEAFEDVRKLVLLQ